MKSARLLLAALLFLAACGADDKPAPPAAREMLARSPSMAAVWPALLQHCGRNPACDPMTRFGDGAGEASGVSGHALWFVRAGETGGVIRISAPGQRGQGGAAGRPLTLAETPATLRGPRDRKSWIWADYSLGADGPELLALSLRTAHLVLPVEGAGEARNRAALRDLTAAHVARATARIDVSAGGETLVSAPAEGVSGDAPMTGEQALKLGAEPWVFTARLDARAGERLAEALLRGDTLVLGATADGGVMLNDVIHAAGFADALESAVAALGDAAILTPLNERCASHAREPDAFWREADLSPAMQTCDPRTPEQRAAAAR